MDAPVVAWIETYWTGRPQFEATELQVRTPSEQHWGPPGYCAISLPDHNLHVGLSVQLQIQSSPEILWMLPL